MIYSYKWADGARSSSPPLRPSVPNDRTNRRRKKRKRKRKKKRKAKEESTADAPHTVLEGHGGFDRVNTVQGAFIAY
jgi:hypothetical protein